MALSNAERQRRFRQRRRAGEAKVVYRRPKAPRSRSRRLKDAVDTIVTIREDCRDWRASVPETLEDTATVVLPEQVPDALDALDPDSLDALELPRGYGRDG